MGLRMKVSCRGFFQVGIIKTPAHGIFAYFLTCMTSPEVQTTKLLSSLRSTITKLVSLSTLSKENDLAALAYITEIVVPASIFLSYETLS